MNEIWKANKTTQLKNIHMLDGTLYESLKTMR